MVPKSDLVEIEGVVGLGGGVAALFRSEFSHKAKNSELGNRIV